MRDQRWENLSEVCAAYLVDWYLSKFDLIMAISKFAHGLHTQGYNGIFSRRRKIQVFPYYLLNVEKIFCIAYIV